MRDNEFTLILGRQRQTRCIDRTGAKDRPILENQPNLAVVMTYVEPDDMRTAFVLFELEGLSVPEIAELTETKQGTVASRLRRARELFQSGVKRLRAREAGDRG